MIDLADPPLVDQLPGQGDSRTPSVVVVEVVDNAGIVGCFIHLFRLGIAQGDRLLAKDVLAGLGRCNRDIVVERLRYSNVHDVDVVPLHDFRPVCLDLGPTPPLGEFSQWSLVPATRHL